MLDKNKIQFLSWHYAKCLVNREFKLCNPGDCKHCNDNQFDRLFNCTEAETYAILNEADFNAPYIRRVAVRRTHNRMARRVRRISTIVAIVLIYIIVKW